MTTRDDLIAKYTTRWPFRPRGPFEGRDQYAAAVVAFLEARSWACSYEVRLGKPQEDWTPDEVQAFAAHLIARRPSAARHAIPTDARASALAQLLTFTDAACPVAWHSLVRLAQLGMDELTKRRAADHFGSVPVLAHVVLTDGRILIGAVDSGDRIAVLKAAARQYPLYGYALVFDGYVHHIDETTGKATQKDSLMAHLGTRDARHILQRPYTIGQTLTFEPETDLDLRQRDGANGRTLEYDDPYGELFITVPTPARVQ